MTNKQLFNATADMNNKAESNGECNLKRSNRVIEINKY